MAEPNNSPGGAGLMDKLKDGAVSQLNAQKDRTTDGIGSIASAVRHSTQQLRDQRHDTIAEYVDEAAARLERFSQSLKEKRVSELVSEAQRFARRNPAVFVGGAFAVGLLTARFFKSSSDHAHDRDWQEGMRHGGYEYGSARIPAGRGQEYRTDIHRPPIGGSSLNTGRS